jgi:hypothetical protein
MAGAGLGNKAIHLFSLALCQSIIELVFINRTRTPARTRMRD